VVVDTATIDICSAILIVQSTTNQPLLQILNRWKRKDGRIAHAMTIMTKAITTAATNWH